MALASATAAWGTMMLGTHWAMCVVCIPLFATLPFALLIWALRKGARPSSGAQERSPVWFLVPLELPPIRSTVRTTRCRLWRSGTLVNLLCALIGKSLGPRLLRW